MTPDLHQLPFTQYIITLTGQVSEWNPGKTYGNSLSRYSVCHIPTTINITDWGNPSKSHVIGILLTLTSQGSPSKWQINLCNPCAHCNVYIIHSLWNGYYIFLCICNRTIYIPTANPSCPSVTSLLLCPCVLFTLYHTSHPHSPVEASPSHLNQLTYKEDRCP